MYHKLQEHQDHLSYAVSKESLTLGEQKSIQSSVLEIYSLEFPLRITWLQFKYSHKHNQKRFLAENQDSIQDWLNSYQSMKIQYKIHDKPIHNMDKKQLFLFCLYPFIF